MSGPDTFAFRMSNAAAASPANPPPTICAFIRPSRPQRELRACRRPPSATADALILQTSALRGWRSRSSDRDHTTSEWRDKDVQANPGFLRLQTFAAQWGFLPTALQITALAAMRRSAPGFTPDRRAQTR